MRQIKNFMEAKRPMWNCNECKCITMQCWKESEAFCGCGDNGWSGRLSNKVSIWWSQWDEAMGIGQSKSAYLFWTYDPENPLDNTVSRVMDIETGVTRIVVWDFECIEDEEARAMLREALESLDAECVANLFRWDEYDDRTRSWTLTAEAMAKFNAAIANPTEENFAKLKTWLEQCCQNAPEEWQIPTPIITVWAPDPIPCTVEATSENSWTFFWISHSEFERSEVTAAIETDPETWDTKIVASAWWVYSDPMFNFEDFIDALENPNGNCRIALLCSLDTECIRKLIWEIDWDGDWEIDRENNFPYFPETCAILDALYQNPTMENWEAARAALDNECLYL